VPGISVPASRNTWYSSGVSRSRHSSSLSAGAPKRLAGVPVSLLIPLSSAFCRDIAREGLGVRNVGAVRRLLGSVCRLLGSVRLPDGFVVLPGPFLAFLDDVLSRAGERLGDLAAGDRGRVEARVVLDVGGAAPL